MSDIHVIIITPPRDMKFSFDCGDYRFRVNKTLIFLAEANVNMICFSPVSGGLRGVKPNAARVHS